MWRFIYFLIALVIFVSSIKFTNNLSSIFIFAVGLIVLSLFDMFVVKKKPSKTLLVAAVSVAFTGILFIITFFVLKILNSAIVDSRYAMLFILLIEGYIMFSIFSSLLPYLSNMLKISKPDKGSISKILDTSVIVDGRICDIAEKKFFDGLLILPEFVIKEIQFLSDSRDSQKRIRGRRALEMLNRMKSSKNIMLSITDVDFLDIKEVDLKLIELAKKMGSKIISNDFNLMKVASIHGVDILNINDLANSLNVVVLPGETITVDLIREGKEKQALAYLEDGTMIVVDNAKHLIGKSAEIEIDAVLPKEAGRVIFAFIAGSRQNSISKKR